MGDDNAVVISLIKKLYNRTGNTGYFDADLAEARGETEGAKRRRGHESPVVPARVPPHVQSAAQPTMAHLLWERDVPYRPPGVSTAHSFPARAPANASNPFYGATQPIARASISEPALAPGEVRCGNDGSNPDCKKIMNPKTTFEVYYCETCSKHFCENCVTKEKDPGWTYFIDIKCPNEECDNDDEIGIIDHDRDVFTRYALTSQGPEKQTEEQWRKKRDGEDESEEESEDDRW